MLDKSVLWLGQNADEIFFLEGLQLDANGQAALKLGDQVGRLGHVKRPGGDEQDVIGSNHAVARVDRGALDDGQNVALHALAGNIGTVAGFAAGHLVNLIDKDDSHLLGALHGHAGDLVHIKKLVFFLLDQVFESVGHAHLALFFLLAEHASDLIHDIDVHLLDALTGDDFERRHGAFTHFNIDHALIQLAFAKLRAKFFTRALVLFALRCRFAFRSPRRRRRRRGK